MIESALAHSRALAYFLAKKPHKGDYHYSHFDSEWEITLEPLGRVIGAVSEHLSHAAIGDPLGEPHPGAWPISELAVVLVGVFATFVDAQRSALHHGWFTPDPADSYLWLMSTDPLHGRPCRAPTLTWVSSPGSCRRTSASRGI